MEGRVDGSDSSLKQSHEQAETYLRLTETLERLARAEEDAAVALAGLNLSDESDELLERAAEHYRWAAQAAQHAIEERKREYELMGDEGDRP